MVRSIDLTAILTRIGAVTLASLNGLKEKMAWSILFAIGGLVRTSTPTLLRVAVTSKASLYVLVLKVHMT